MSDCCGNPWVSTPPKNLKDVEYKIYNPSEIRLYGRPAATTPKVAIANEDLDKIKANIKENQTFKDNFASDFDKIQEIFDEIVAYAGRKIDENTDNITKYIQRGIIVASQFDNKNFSMPISINMPNSGYGDDYQNYIKSIGVIYGYAYEGHCYKLPKPQIMFLPELPRNIPGDDCGCDCGYSSKLGYAVWQIDKLQRVVALDIRSDDLKTLVLEENMPGNRSPQAYSQSMSLAPQRLRD
ncbi:MULTISPECIES: hypothetical protein [unclassified Sinorhizobium]|uniref:hypothetical protein n=1 Tax=unclassified Sinorhizobium TaxID=2613772 RepID=UPI003526B767